MNSELHYQTLETGVVRMSVHELKLKRKSVMQQPKAHKLYDQRLVKVE